MKPGLGNGKCVEQVGGEKVRGELVINRRVSSREHVICRGEAGS